MDPGGSSCLLLCTGDVGEGSEVASLSSLCGAAAPSWLNSLSTSDLPMAPYSLQVMLWQLQVLYPSLQGRYVHGFFYCCACFSVRGTCCRKLEGLPQREAPIMTVPGLV